MKEKELKSNVYKYGIIVKHTSEQYTEKINPRDLINKYESILNLKEQGIIRHYANNGILNINLKAFKIIQYLKQLGGQNENNYVGYTNDNSIYYICKETNIIKCFGKEYITDNNVLDNIVSFNEFKELFLINEDMKERIIKIPFSLDIYKSGEYEKIQLRDGRDIKILVTDMENVPYPLVVAIDNGGAKHNYYGYTFNGKLGKPLNEDIEDTDIIMYIKDNIKINELVTHYHNDIQAYVIRKYAGDGNVYNSDDVTFYKPNSAIIKLSDYINNN